MKGILVFAILLSTYLCSGRYFTERFSGYKPPCEDDPNYADECPERAAEKDYCKDQEKFMKKQCPKSCRFCSEGTAHPPFPKVCKDAPAYADKCPVKATIEGYCKNHEEFMKKNCPKTCGYCSIEP